MVDFERRRVLKYAGAGAIATGSAIAALAVRQLLPPTEPEALPLTLEERIRLLEALEAARERTSGFGSPSLENIGGILSTTKGGTGRSNTPTAFGLLRGFSTTYANFPLGSTPGRTLVQTSAAAFAWTTHDNTAHSKSYLHSFEPAAILPVAGPISVGTGETVLKTESFSPPAGEEWFVIPFYILNVKWTNLAAGNPFFRLRLYAKTEVGGVPASFLSIANTFDAHQGEDTTFKHQVSYGQFYFDIADASNVAFHDAPFGNAAGDEIYSLELRGITSAGTVDATDIRMAGFIIKRDIP